MTLLTETKNYSFIRINNYNIIMLTLQANSYLVFPFCSLGSALKEVGHSEYLDKEVHLHNK